MVAYFSEHPAQLAVLVAVLFLCIFAWVKALRAVKKRAAAKAQLIETLEHEKKLRADFRTLERGVLAETPPERLIEGVCCHIQMALEKAPALEEAFAALPEHERLIYALGYVVQDTRKGLGAFFRANGKPLTPTALQAVEQLVGGDYAALFRSAYEAFDEDNEVVSLTKEQVQVWDAAFAELLRGRTDAIYTEAKDYIIAHF
jgi:hypothetical protein